MINNKDEIKRLIKKIKWNKVPIIKRTQNRRRTTLALDIQEFVKDLNDFQSTGYSM